MAQKLGDDLAVAQAHVERAMKFVARQRAQVDRVRAMGRPAADAEQTLALYERTLKTFEGHLRILEGEAARRQHLAGRR